MARGNSYDEMAKAAVERMQQNRELAEQLTLLPDEQPIVEDASTPKRGKGKALNQMREFMAAKGYRMPEDVLVQLAGLTTGQDVFEMAMARTEQQLAWAFNKATKREKRGDTWVDVPLLPTPVQRMSAFENNVAVILRANDALMPYGTPKATPDAGPGVVVPVYVNAAPSSPADQPRDVTPQTVQIGSRMMPADVAHEMQQNQQVSEGDSDQSDKESRTE